MSNGNTDKQRYYGVRTVEIQEVSDKEASFLAVASTSDVGRDGHIVEAEGWVLDNYLKDPIVPFAHDTGRLPVAKSIETRVQGKRLMFRPRFAVEMPVEGWPANVPHPRIVYPLYTHGYLNAFSVSWEPIRFREMDEKERKKYLKTPYQQRFGGLVFEQQELLEISVVPLPADPKALKRAYSDGIDCRAVYEWLQAHRGAGEIAQVEKPIERHYFYLSQLAGEVEAPEVAPAEGKDEREVAPEEGQETARAAVPYAAHGDVAKADEGKMWDAAKARRALARWASSDGSGDADTMDWQKYRLGFAWYDSGNPAAFGSYRFPHHTVTDGKLTVVWRGVAAAMQRLLSTGETKTTVPAKDRRGIYNHLKKEYARFGKDVPDFRAYTADELARQFEGVFEDMSELIDPGTDGTENKAEAALEDRALAVPKTLREAQERLLRLFSEHGHEDSPSSEAWDEYLAISYAYEASGMECPEFTDYEPGELGLIFHELGDKPRECFSDPSLIDSVYSEDDTGRIVVRRCACGRTQRQLVTWDDTPIWKLPTDAGARLVKAAGESPDRLVAEANAIFTEQHQKYMARARGAVLSTTLRRELSQVVSHLSAVLEAGAVLPESGTVETTTERDAADINPKRATGQPEQSASHANRDGEGGNVEEGKATDAETRSDAATDGDVWVIELEESEPQPEPAGAERTGSEEQPPADNTIDLSDVGGVEGLSQTIKDATVEALKSALRRRMGALE